MNTAFGDRHALNGLSKKLHAHGVPLEVVSDIAGACYPAGAERERKKSGHSFAKPLVDPREASRVVADLLQMSSSEVNANLIAQLDFLFGHDYVEAWLKQRPEQQSQPDASPARAQSTSTAFGDRLALRGLQKKLVHHGIPLEIATQLAGACYPAGARKETLLTGFVFAQPIVTQSRAYELIDSFFAMPRAEVSHKHIRRLLDLLLGSQCVQKWLDELDEAERKQEDARGEQRKAEHEASSNAIPVVVASFLALGMLILVGAVVLNPSRRDQAVSKPPATNLNGVAENRNAVPGASKVRDPRSAPRPPSATTRLSQAIADGGRAVAVKDYERAYKTLHSLFATIQPKDIRDAKTWRSFLVLHSDALDGIKPDNTYSYWNAVSDNGIAWHEAMKQAMRAKETSDAQDAYRRAEEYYKRVARSNAVLSRSAGPGGRDDERKRRILVGLAMENMAVLELQFANYTKDKELHREARGRIEKCWEYLASKFGRNSQEYRSSVEEWNKQESVGSGP